MDVSAPLEPTDEELDMMAGVVAERDGLSIEQAREWVLAVLAEQQQE